MPNNIQQHFELKFGAKSLMTLTRKPWLDNQFFIAPMVVVLPWLHCKIQRITLIAREVTRLYLICCDPSQLSLLL